MRVLLICGDYWHPAQTVIDGLAPLRDKDFDFDIITDAKEFSPEMLKGYPAVLLSKCDETSQTDKTAWKTPAVQQAFVSFVENGGGLLAIHTATVAGEHTEVLDRLLGCRFATHPKDCPVTVQPVKPHPVTHGTGQFIETDEHYALDIILPDCDIILASYSPPANREAWYDETIPYFSSPGMVCPAGIVREQGKGRICVLTPGHFLPVWHNPEYQRVLENALLWCGGV